MVDLYEPAAHGEHGVSVYPAAQSMQVLCPDDEVVPSGHVKQLETSIMLTDGLYVPAGQATHGGSLDASVQ